MGLCPNPPLCPCGVTGADRGCFRCWLERPCLDFHRPDCKVCRDVHVYHWLQPQSEREALCRAFLSSQGNGTSCYWGFPASVDAKPRYAYPPRGDNPSHGCDEHHRDGSIRCFGNELGRKGLIGAGDRQAVIMGAATCKPVGVGTRQTDCSSKKGKCQNKHQA